MRRGYILVLTLFLLSACGLASPDVKDDPDFQALEGKVDRMSETLTTQVSALREDVAELRAIVQPETASAAEGEARVPPAPQMSPAEVKQAYSRGRSLYVKGEYEAAARVFEEILRKAPTADLAPNAGYWLGECYYSRAMFREAAGRFKSVVDKYPASSKAPDAMLKTAYSHHQLGQGKEAMIYLRDLLKRYPESRAAGMIRKGQTLFKYPLNPA